MDLFLCFQIYHLKSRDNNTCAGGMPLACKVASLQTLQEAEQMQSNAGLERETCWQPALAQDGPLTGANKTWPHLKRKIVQPIFVVRFLNA